MLYAHQAQSHRKKYSIGILGPFVMLVYEDNDQYTFMQSASHSSGCYINIAYLLELCFKFCVSEEGTTVSFLCQS